MYTAHIPQRCSTIDHDYFIQKVPIAAQEDKSFDAWMLDCSRLIIIHGGEERTRFGAWLLIETIVRNNTLKPNEMRFSWQSAPLMFDKLTNEKFREETASLRHIFANCGMLVLDDIHELDEYMLRQLAVTVKSRCNEEKITVLTTTDTGHQFLMRMPTITPDIVRGRVIKL